MFHNPDSPGAPNMGNQNRIGNVPIKHYVASEQLLRQLGNSNVTLFPANVGDQDSTYGLEADEIAFEVKNAPRVFGNDFGRFLGSHTSAAEVTDQHSSPVVQTSLNGFDTNDESLIKSQDFATTRGLTDEDAREFVRDAIRAKIEPKGVVMTAKHYKDGGIPDSAIRGQPVNLQVSGLCSLPCILGNIRAGSYVEAVPMVPSEYEFAAANYGGLKYRSGKAQVVIREVTRLSLATRLHRNCALLMNHYDALTDAFGSDSNAMQSVAAANGLSRFAQFAALQFLSFLVEKGLITSIAGVDLDAAGAPVTTNNSASSDIIKLVARGISSVRGTRLAPTVDQINAGDVRADAPRPRFGEVAPVLGVLMGTIAASRSNNGRFDASTREQLQEPETKAEWMKLTRDFMARVFYFPSLQNKFLDFQHGWIQAVQGNPASALGSKFTTTPRGADWSYNAYRQDINTRQYSPDPTSSAGRWVTLQQIEPLDCIMSVMSGLNHCTKDIIGSAVSDGQAGAGPVGCDVILTPNGVFR